MNSKILFLSALLVLLFGCATSRYMTADRYLKANDYENALREYLKIAESGSSLGLSKDIRALSGAMIAYFKLGKYKQSFALSKQILSQDRRNSCAIFYGGMNLEMLNKKPLAKKVYRFYTSMSRSDPYYKLSKARFQQLVKDEIGQRIAMAVKMENQIGDHQIEDNAIGVLYFLNVMEDPNWNSLSKGLAEMMITDLSQVNQLKVLERVYLEKLIEEMQLGMAGLADEATAPRFGRLMGAKNLVNGSFTIKADRYLSIQTNLINTKSRSALQGKEMSGELTELFDFEKDIVFSVIDQLGIKLTPEQRKRIGMNRTKSLEAFKAFCRGLEQYDLGDYSAAVTSFREANRLDPGFILAANYLDLAMALESIEQGSFIAAFFEAGISGPAGKDQALGTLSTSAEDRLMQLSQNLELGYLPGNDSRNGASELLFDSRFWEEDWRNQEVLPLPPTPPSVPPR
ncbi:MAG: hypothetical protein ONB33_11790 [candidate division KSB1 bacterium]|nr:hypothetical protein [candidate division KSB1 bacterium]